MSKCKKIRRVLKWAGIGLISLVAILLIINAVAVWITDSQVEERLAAIRAAGDPVSLRDFRMEEVPVEDNAATYLKRADHDARSLEAKLYTPLWDKMFQKASDGDYLEAVYPTEEVQEAIESAFAAHPHLLPLIEQAANSPAYSDDPWEGCDRNTMTTNEMMEVLMKNLQEKKMFARTLYLWHYSLLYSRKQYEGCVKDGLVLLKLTRHTEKDPTLLGFLTNCAMYGQSMAIINTALQSGQVSDELRQEVENELAKVDIRQFLLHALKTERAFANDEFPELQNRASWFARFIINRGILGMLDAFDWYILRTADSLTEGNLDTFMNVSQTPILSGNMFAGQVSEGLQGAEKAARRIETEVRTLRIINALGRCADPDKEPMPDLSDLDLPKSVTTDPYSGKPLIVKKVDGGWLVYSVGENGTDEGGDLRDLKDIGMKPERWAKAKSAEERQKEEKGASDQK